MPRDALTRTTSPSRSRGGRNSSAASASGTTVTRAGSMPAAMAPSAIPAAAWPTTRSQSAVRAAASPTTWWPSWCTLPSSSISPSTAPRRPGSPASRSSAATTDRGEALYVSSTRVTRPARTSWTRCGADQPASSPLAIASRDMPAARPTAAAARALWTDRRPSVGMTNGRRPASVRSTKRMPARPADSTASAPTSAAGSKP